LKLDPSRRLRLSPHADLKSRADGEVLVLPERAIRIGGSGAEILGLCREERSGKSILTVMRERYPGAPGIESEVLAFLEEMLELGGLVVPDERLEVEE